MTASSYFRLLPGLKVAALLIGLIALFTMGRRQSAPVVETTPGPAEALRTISGTVRGAEGTGSIEGRVVEVINTEGGEGQRVTTTTAGGFTFKVKPGKYRVQLQLRAGETILKQPGVMNVNRSDVDAHANFVIGQGRVARPRLPIKQGDMGLGPPIA
jgi:carboxypeptidase family protein